MKFNSLFIFICLILLTTSCGVPLKSNKRDMVYVKGVTTKQFAVSDNTFSSYIAKFEAYGKQELKDPSFAVGDIPINFGDTTEPGYDGVCFVYPDQSKEIIVRKEWWEKANRIQKEVLIFHELGHCRLGRTHDEETVDINNQTVKTSIMNPVIPDSNSYTSNQDGYIRELFTYSKNTLLSLLGVAQN